MMITEPTKKLFSRCFAGFILVVLGMFLGLRLFPVISERKNSARSFEFGDLKFDVVVPSDANESRTHELAAYKGGSEPFLWAYKNKEEEVVEMLLLRGGDSSKINLSLKSNGRNNGWKQARYGHEKNGAIEGEAYFDFDFDGQFDTKIIFPSDGSLESRSIYYDTQWITVERFEGRKAFTEHTWYLFYKDFGWVSEDEYEKIINNKN